MVYIYVYVSIFFRSPQCLLECVLGPHFRYCMQYIPRIMQMNRAFLCFVVVCHQSIVLYSLRRHQMEAFSELLALCVGNSPVTGEFPAQRPVTRSFYVFYHILQAYLFETCNYAGLSKRCWRLWSNTSHESPKNYDKTTVNEAQTLVWVFHKKYIVYCPSCITRTAVLKYFNSLPLGDLNKILD